MRQRKVKNIDEKLAALAEYMIETPEDYKGKWREVFGNDNPIYLEIGCGKGQFIYRHASANKDVNYIAIEGQDSVAIRAAEKAKQLADETGARNLRVICAFVNDIGDMFEDGELAGVYLNFSDPWPKAGHKKRRLTYRDRLSSYMKALASGGFIEIKTDNVSLFEFTKEEIEALALPVTAYSDDYHAEITTEYEDKFRAQGIPIHYVRIDKIK